MSRRLLPPSRVCRGCGLDLAGVRPRLLSLGFRAVTCPKCGRVLPLRRRPRRRAAAAALVSATLGIQVLIGTALLLVSCWFIAGAAAEIVRIAPGGDLAAVLTARQGGRGPRLLTIWLEENWLVFLCHAWAGVWACLSLSHWRRRYARIPAWLGALAALLAAVWIWPTLEGWWQRGAIVRPNMDILAAMGLLVLAGAPLMAFWIPFETALMRHFNTESILADLMQRRLARSAPRRRARHA